MPENPEARLFQLLTILTVNGFEKNMEITESIATELEDISYRYIMQRPI